MASMLGQRVLARLLSRKCSVPENSASAISQSKLASHPSTKYPPLKDASEYTADEVTPARSPSQHELDELEWGGQLNGPTASAVPTPSALEAASGTSSPRALTSPQNITTVLPSMTQPYMNRHRCVSACLAFFIQGLNDSAPGALIPSIEVHYRISYAIVSLIFVANAVGFITAAPLCHVLNHRFGRAKVLSICTLVNALAYIALVCQPPFPVVVIAFALLGFGFATILALDNVFIINLRNGTVLLGAMHGCYGIGGTVAPFIATGMISARIRWSFFYIVPLCLSLLNSGLFAWSFQNYETEVANQITTALEMTASRRTSSAERKSILKKALKNKTTLLGALLIFAYQGAEVSISGWVISFLIAYRHGDPSQVGYVTAGFWGGITLSRFLLVQPAHKVGEKITVIILVALTAAFQLLLWFLPNIVANAVAVALIGVMLGPVYPCATSVFSKLLPSELQITSLGFISSMGSSGGAVAPFFTGLLAQKYGTVVLNPICIALCVVMELAWFGLPRIDKRTE